MVLVFVLVARMKVLIYVLWLGQYKPLSCVEIKKQTTPRAIDADPLSD
jgi:hypothetical protein